MNFELSRMLSLCDKGGHVGADSALSQIWGKMKEIVQSRGGDAGFRCTPFHRACGTVKRHGFQMGGNGRFECSFEPLNQTTHVSLSQGADDETLLRVAHGGSHRTRPTRAR